LIIGTGVDDVTVLAAGTSLTAATALLLVPFWLLDRALDAGTALLLVPLELYW
jgi:hypothetical protein